MLIIDAIRRQLKGGQSGPEQDKGPGPWLLPVVAMVFFACILLAALLIKHL